MKNIFAIRDNNYDAFDIFILFCLIVMKINCKSCKTEKRGLPNFLNIYKIL